MKSKKNVKLPKMKPVPRTCEELRPVDKAFINSVMFDVGILPMEHTGLDMGRPLKQISVEEARVIKRKFRKMWRKLMQKEITERISVGKSIQPMRNAEDVADRAKKSVKLKFGSGKQIPSKQDKLNRKRAVFEFIWTNTIAPMLSKFENPERENAHSQETEAALLR